MRTFLLGIIFLVAQTGQAQENTIVVEVLGNGGMASVNYERQLTHRPTLNFRVGVGVSLFEPKEPECPPENAYCDFLNFPDPDLSIPFSFHYLIDLKRNNYLETGIGYTLQLGSSRYDEKNTNLYFASLGYRRYFGRGRKWMWKANLSPVLIAAASEVERNRFIPWLGFSIGRRF